MGIEGSLQASILSYLNKLPGCRAENVSGNANQSGRPDINGCYLGRMFKFELKTIDHQNTPTKKQSLELKKWRRAGCVTGILYSTKALKEAMDLIRTTHSNIEIEYSWEEGNGCISWIVIPPMKV